MSNSHKSWVVPLSITAFFRFWVGWIRVTQCHGIHFAFQFQIIRTFFLKVFMLVTFETSDTLCGLGFFSIFLFEFPFLPSRTLDFSNYIKRVLRTTWQKSLQIWWDFRQIWLDLIGSWMDLVRTHRIWRDLANFLWFSASPETNHHLIFTRTIQLDSLTSWLWVRDLPTQSGRVGWGLSTSSTKTNPWSTLIKTSSKKWLL